MPVNQAGGGADSVPPPAVQIRGLVKRFAGVPALRGVDLVIEAGQVHGLLGANGSGKSTLIKTLAGFHDADAGQFFVAGTEIEQPFGPGGLRRYGVTFVHQDLGLSNDSTVLEHLVLDHSLRGAGLRSISWRAERRRVRALLARFEVTVDVDDRIAALSPVQRALVAIIRAVSAQEETLGGVAAARLLVLDEPTVFLPRTEVAMLLRLLRRLAADGAAVLLVSHDLDEVLGVTDQLTVLRDGANVGTVRTAQTSRAEVVRMILGRGDEHVARATSRTDADAPPRITVRGLTGQTVTDLDLDLRAGEVVGITGLAGSGFEELPDLLYGAHARRGGQVVVDGTEIRKIHPVDMLRHRVILIPADRKTSASAPLLTMLENLSVPFLAGSFRGGRLRWKLLRQRARDICADYSVTPPNPHVAFGSLSGGNQQKALIGKWLSTDPAVMLLNEPTQGVDVGARREIFALIRAAVANGMAVLCATSDYEQLVELADRVIVLADGRQTRELSGDEITKDDLAGAVLAGAVAAGEP